MARGARTGTNMVCLGLGLRLFWKVQRRGTRKTALCGSAAARQRGSGRKTEPDRTRQKPQKVGVATIKVPRALEIGPPHVFRSTLALYGFREAAVPEAERMGNHFFGDTTARPKQGRAKECTEQRFLEPPYKASSDVAHLFWTNKISTQFAHRVPKKRGGRGSANCQGQTPGAGLRQTGGQQGAFSFTSC